MESQYLTNQTLDWLIHILATSIKTVENQSKKEQMEKWLNVLKKIRTAENIEEIEDEKAAQNLLDTIS
jgi:hypothetical protein